MESGTKTKLEKKEEAPAFLEDNPCWGSNNQHRLEDLLSIIDRSSSIVYDSPQYLVLNKPPDLRMDGQYAATVHKLLTYWYPPPSLSTKNQTVEETTNKSDGNADLLEAVSRLHQYNDVRDNFLRPCHQLDYATSGVLLVGKTQEAASHIGKLFEERHEGVQKSYMAIVVGDVRKDLLGHESSNESKPRVPIWTEGNTTRDLREQLQRLEETYRRSRAAAGKQHCRLRDASSKNKNKKKNTNSSFAGSTFQGFQPAHSLFAKWKSKLKAEALAKTSGETGDSSPPPKKKLKRRKKNSAGALLTDDDWKKIWEPVNEVFGDTMVAAIEFEKLEWKKLHEKHYALKQAIIQAADIHNNILRNTIEKKQQEEAEKEMLDDGGKDFPVLFRLSSNSENSDKGCENDDSTFYVCCPLAQHPDQFNMAIPSSVARENPQLTTPLGSGDETNDKLKFRPSLTKCTILETGTLSIVRNNAETNIDVTKVRLYPMTGRRHQLRVHMALSGFPILGDVAYGGDRFVRRKKDQGDDCEQETERDIYPRMCLHAHSLQLPTLIGESEPNWKIATPDPFLFDSNGRLKLQ